MLVPDMTEPNIPETDMTEPGTKEPDMKVPGTKEPDTIENIWKSHIRHSHLQVLITSVSGVTSCASAVRSYSHIQATLSISSYHESAADRSIRQYLFRFRSDPSSAEVVGP